jgi:hypothetical protein
MTATSKRPALEISFTDDPRVVKEAATDGP